jgi:hypothetical protein
MVRVFEAHYRFLTFAAANMLFSSIWQALPQRQIGGVWVCWPRVVRSFAEGGDHDDRKAGMPEQGVLGGFKLPVRPVTPLPP